MFRTMMLALAAALILSASSTHAAGWRLRANAQANFQGGPAHGFDQRAPRRVGSQAFDPRFQNYYRGMYPKYIGGFNAHDFNRIGVPTGDIGIRGNGIVPTPW
jgi:hypothetical protein